MDIARLNRRGLNFLSSPSGLAFLNSVGFSQF